MEIPIVVGTRRCVMAARWTIAGDNAAVVALALVNDHEKRRREHLVHVVVIVFGQGKLLEIVATLRSWRRLAR